MTKTHNDPPSEEIAEEISTEKNSGPDEMITLHLTVIPERKIPTGPIIEQISAVMMEIGGIPGPET